MKKPIKRKSALEPTDLVSPQVETNIEGHILKMQQQLNLLEKKIDALISQSSEKSFERKHHPKPFQRFDHSRHQSETRQNNSYRERVLHKVICAECKKECEVPFRPSGGRPVYCKDCFSKRKGGGPFKERSDNRPRERDFTQERHFGKHPGGGNRKPYEKKRHIFKKRRKT